MRCRVCGYEFGNETACPFSLKEFGNNLPAQDSELMIKGKLSDAEHHTRVARWILHHKAQQPQELISWAKQTLHAAETQGWG